MTVVARMKFKPIGLLSAVMGTLILTACQTTPMQSPSPQVVTSSPATLPSTAGQTPYEDADDHVETYPIEPYIPPARTVVISPTPVETSRPETSSPVIILSETEEDIPNPTKADENSPQSPIAVKEPVVSLPSHSDLLERARQHSQKQERQTSSEKADLPAFQNLIQAGINDLKNNNLSAAESSFSRAQRLVPQSSAAYYYLSQVALKKNQPRKAEAMARRGLSVSQDANRRRALWQLVLRSGQLQNNSRVIREAQQALK